MSNDPFANDPFADAPDEAQTETQTEVQEDTVTETKAPAKKAAAKKVANKPAPAVAASEGKVVLTFKGGAGFDAPWIVIHAESLEDAYDQVTEENAKLLADLMGKVQSAGQHFVKLGGGSPNSNGGQNSGGRRGAPQGAQEAPNGEERYCAHGKMQFKSGVSKAGNTYKGFFCPSRDRNEQCKAQFLK